MIRQSEVTVTKRVNPKQNWVLIDGRVEIRDSAGLHKLFDVESAKEVHTEVVEMELAAKVITQIYGDVRQEAAKANVLLNKISCLLAPGASFQSVWELRALLNNFEEAGLHEELNHHKVDPPPEGETSNT